MNNILITSKINNFIIKIFQCMCPMIPYLLKIDSFVSQYLKVQAYYTHNTHKEIRTSF